MKTPFVLQILDIVLLSGGIILVLVGVFAVMFRRKWAEAGRLPSLPVTRLEPLDVLIALFSFFILPPVVLQAAALCGFGAGISREPGPATMPQLLSSGIAMSLAIVALLVIGRSRFEMGCRGWGLTLQRPGWQLLQATTAYLMIIPVCTVLLSLSKLVLERLGHSPPRHAMIETLLDPAAPAALRAIAAVNAVVLAAVAEELLFRGLLLPALAKWSRSWWIAIAAGGAAFGLIHHPYDDTILPLAAFGVILGYLYVRTGSLTLVILTHAIFNAKTMLWLYLGALPE